ncbi:hypothetical protein D9M68_650090 [compost metagenome]
MRLERRPLHLLRRVDIPDVGGALDQRIAPQQTRQSQALPRPPIAGGAGLRGGVIPGWGRGKIARRFSRRGRGIRRRRLLPRPRLRQCRALRQLHPQRPCRGLGCRPHITAMLEQAEHIEGIVLVPVRQRVRAVVREHPALRHRHTRQPGAALRAEPLLPALLVPVRLQQVLHVVRLVEGIDHRGLVTPARCRRPLLRQWRRNGRPGARLLGHALEHIPAVPDIQQIVRQLRQPIGCRRRSPGVRPPRAGVDGGR